MLTLKKLTATLTTAGEILKISGSHFFIPVRHPVDGAESMRKEFWLERWQQNPICLGRLIPHTLAHGKHHLP